MENLNAWVMFAVVMVFVGIAVHAALSQQVRFSDIVVKPTLPGLPTSVADAGCRLVGQ